MSESAAMPSSLARQLVLATALALIGGGSAGYLWGLSGEWGVAPGLGPGLGWRAAIAAVGPLFSGLWLLLCWRSTRPGFRPGNWRPLWRARWWALWPLTGALLAAGVSGWLAWELSAVAGERAAVVLAAAAALPVGWLLLIAAGADQRGLALPKSGSGHASAHRAWSAVAATITLTGVGIGAVGWTGWFTEERWREHVTTPALAEESLPPPGVEQLHWQETAGDLHWVEVAAGQLLLATPDGVRTRSLATGEPRWSYLRQDALVEHLALSSDRRTLIVQQVLRPGTAAAEAVMVALDTATGELRWQRSGLLERGSSPHDQVLASGELVIFGRVMPGASDFTAVDVAAGEVRWHWRPAVGPDDRSRCTVHGAGVDAELLLVITDCPDGGAWRSQAIAVELADGGERWRHELEPADPRIAQPRIWAVAGQVLIGSGNFEELAARTWVTLDPMTGEELQRTSATGPELLAAEGHLLTLTADGTAESIDLAIGEAAWRQHQPDLADRPVVAASHAGTVAYLLVPADPTVRGRSEWVPLRVVSVDLATGDTTAGPELATGLACGDQRTDRINDDCLPYPTLVAESGAVVVMTPTERGSACARSWSPRPRCLVGAGLAHEAEISVLTAR